MFLILGRQLPILRVLLPLTSIPELLVCVVRVLSLLRGGGSGGGVVLPVVVRLFVRTVVAVARACPCGFRLRYMGGASAARARRVCMQMCAHILLSDTAYERPCALQAEDTVNTQ